MTLKLSNDFMTLYMAVDGQLFEVTHIALTSGEANRYLEEHPGESVIAETPRIMNTAIIYIAKDKASQRIDTLSQRL